MQVNNLNSTNFGLNIQTNPYGRTKEQEKFLNQCLHNNDLTSFDNVVSTFDFGNISIEEDDKGNSSITVKLKNDLGKQVESLKEKFDLGHKKTNAINEQLKEFLERLNLHIDVLVKYSDKESEKIRELIKIHEDGMDFEDSCKRAGWNI